ncbi:MAG: DUF805 domain-containing protein [Croceibacterium sp.]
MEWMLMPLRRYAEFSGRSRRKEYWMFALFNAIIIALFYVLMLAGGGGDFLRTATAGPGREIASLSAGSFGPLFWVGAGLLALYCLAIVVPSIAVAIRRLHDRNLTGWIYLGVIVASFIPVVGILAGLAFLVLMLLPGTPGPNKYGPDPLDPAQADVFA